MLKVTEAADSPVPRDGCVELGPVFRRADQLVPRPRLKLSTAEPGRDEAWRNYRLPGSGSIAASVLGSKSQAKNIRSLAPDRAALLAERAEHLPPNDRVLLKAIYAQGHSVSTLAQLRREPARRVSRHIQRLAARCTSPEFAFVVLHLDTFPGLLKQVAQSCILGGQTVRRAAMELGVSQYAVRTCRTELLAMVKGAESARRLLERARERSRD